MRSWMPSAVVRSRAAASAIEIKVMDSSSVQRHPVRCLVGTFRRSPTGHGGRFGERLQAHDGSDPVNCVFNVRHGPGESAAAAGALREQRAGTRADARLAPDDVGVAGLAADLMGRISPTLCMWARRRDDGSLAWLSGGFAELTGHDAEDYLGRSNLMTRVVHPDDLGMFRGAPGDSRNRC